LDWTFGWMRSWDEVLARDHLERWRSAAVQPGSHASPFMHPDMIRGWLAAVGGPGAWDPFLMAARHAGGQQVLWLLVRPRGRHAGLVRRLLPPGEGLGGPHFAYNDPLVIPAASPDAVLAPGFWPAFDRLLEAKLSSAHGSPTA